ncbi:thiol reductant ABC exporter subunit CydD [Thiolapillus sp.]
MKAEERWLRQQQHLAGPWLKLSALMGWGSVLTLGTLAWLLASIIDNLSFGHASLESQWPALIGLLILLPLRTLLGWCNEQFASHAAVRVKTKLREKLFAHMQRVGPAWLGRHDQGALLTLLSDGIEALDGYYSRYLPATTQLIFAPLTLLLFIAPQDWLSALILIATAPLIPFFMILIGKGAESRNQRQWRQLTRMGAHFLDMIRGLTTLRLFNAGQREADSVKQASEAYRRSTLSVLRIAFLSSFTLEFFSTASIAVVAVIIGFRLYWGEMEFIHGFFILLLAPEFYLPLRKLGSSYHDRMEALGAADQLMEIHALSAPATDHSRRTYLPSHPHGIQLQLKSVSFLWPESNNGLHDLSLDIEAGERIAIVGPSGAGKSTLMNLLLGFLQPDKGEILADRQSLQHLDPRSWRSQLAWVPQRPHLFHGTIADNIALGANQASDEQILDAARAAHCLEFIENLPQGMNTIVGEGGHGLSGGQRQRIALARAFLRQARLLLLDEPTANLDLASEKLIGQTVDRLSQKTTTIAIAHRLQTVINADRILVLDHGQVVQQGNHQRLMRESGPYARLLGKGWRNP